MEPETGKNASNVQVTSEVSKLNPDSNLVNPTILFKVSPERNTGVEYKRETAVSEPTVRGFKLVEKKRIIKKIRKFNRFTTILPYIYTYLYYPLVF